MTTALIADLDGIWWVEVPGAVVLDRKWLRENYGPHPADAYAYGGERQETVDVDRTA